MPILTENGWNESLALGNQGQILKILFSQRKWYAKQPKNG